MTIINLHEDLQYQIDIYGPPENSVPATDEQISRLSELVPSTYVDFVRAYGFGSYYDGLFQMCDPDSMRSILAMVFRGDSEFNHRDCHVVGYTAFGELRCWSEQFNSFEIELHLGMIFNTTLTELHWRRKATVEKLAASLIPSPDSIDFEDHLGEPMYERCQAIHGKLGPGECYGFFPALAVAGVFGPMQRVENIKRIKAMEHFAILAQLGEFYLTRIGREGVEAVRPIG